MAKSPTKGKADAPPAADSPAVLCTAIKQVFETAFGNDKDVQLLDEEFFNLTNHDRLRLQTEAAIFEARRKRRQERRLQQREEEDNQRILNLRNNPNNLGACAVKMQKMFRVMRQSMLYYALLFSMRDRPKKKAVIILMEGHDDKRIRALPSVVREQTIQLCRSLQLMSFQVDLLWNGPNAAGGASVPAAVRPTKPNILRALNDAAMFRGDAEEGLVWVHICGTGGVATVSGRNPHKVAAEGSVSQTPRTRMLRALASTVSASTTASGGGDSCYYVLPTDIRSLRLTFDAVITVDDVCDVLALKPETTIYNRSTLQRIVSMEVVPLGSVEGSTGTSGFGMFASTVTQKIIMDYPPAVPVPPAGSLLSTAAGEQQPVEPVRGLLTHILLKAVGGGVGWGKIAATQRTGRTHAGRGIGAAFDELASRSGGQTPSVPSLNGVAKPRGSVAPDPKANAELTVKKSVLDRKYRSYLSALSHLQVVTDTDLPGLTAGMMVALIQSVCGDLPSVRLTKSGKAWHDFTIISPERGAIGLNFFDRVMGWTTTTGAAAELAAVTGTAVPSVTTAASFSTSAPNAGASAAGGAASSVARQRKRRPGASLRPASMSATIRVDLTKKEARSMNLFDADLWAVCVMWLQVYSQLEPTSLQVARHQKLQMMGATTGFGALTLASALSAVQNVAAAGGSSKINAMGLTRRVLIGIGATSIEIASKCKARGTTDAMAWAELVKKLTRPHAADRHLNASQFGSPPRASGNNASPAPTAVTFSKDPATDSTNNAPQGDASATPQPADAPSPTAASKERTASPTRADDGGSPTKSAASGATEVGFQLWLGKAEEGFVTLVLETHTVEDYHYLIETLTNTDVVAETLCGAPVTHVYVDVRCDVLGTLSSFEQLRLTCQGLTISTDQLGTAGVMHPLCTHSVFAPSVMTDGLMENLLTQLSAIAAPQPPKRAAEWIQRFAGEKKCFRMLDIRSTCLNRVNELDDAALELLTRRERSTGNAAYHGTGGSTGIALCVVITGTSFDYRMKQCVELEAFADYEMTHNVRCMIWDTTEPLKPAAGGGAVADASAAKKEKTVKLFEAIRDAIPVANFPALIMMDLFKKRYYRCTLPTAAYGGSASTQPTVPVAAPAPEPAPTPEPLAGSAVRATSTPSMETRSSTPPPAQVSLAPIQPVVHLPVSTAPVVYQAAQISKFIDAFVKGSLNDLLPPVKGCRVYGGAQNRSKYTLIAV